MTGMPKPTDNHKKLQKLAGTWVGEEKMNPSPLGPGGNAVGRYHHRIDLEGFFIIQDYTQEKDGKLSYRGHGIFGYDDLNKTFAWYWVDSMGMVPPSPSRGQWDGNTLLLEHEAFGDSRGRYTFRFISDNNFLFQIENSQDGGKSWQLFLLGNYNKV